MVILAQTPLDDTAECLFPGVRQFRARDFLVIIGHWWQVPLDPRIQNSDHEIIAAKQIWTRIISFFEVSRSACELQTIHRLARCTLAALISDLDLSGLLCVHVGLCLAPLRLHSSM